MTDQPDDDVQDYDLPTDAHEAHKEATRLHKAAQQAERALEEARGRFLPNVARGYFQRLPDAMKAAEAATRTRVAGTNLKAAAHAHGLAHPPDALLYLDPADYADDDGVPDWTAMATALTALTDVRPYLTGRTTTRFKGGADSGPKGGADYAPDLGDLTVEQYRHRRGIGRKRR